MCIFRKLMKFSKWQPLIRKTSLWFLCVRFAFLFTTDSLPNIFWSVIKLPLRKRGQFSGTHVTCRITTGLNFFISEACALFAPKILSISCRDSTLYAKWWCSSFWVLYNFVIGVLFLKNDPLKSGVSDDLETTLKIMLLYVTKNSSILRLICYASSPLF